MTRKSISGAWHKLAPYRVKLTLVELHTADLGTWQVYEWELWEGAAFVDKGSLPYGDSYIVPADVLDQLEYLYLERHQLVPAEETFDPTYGL